MAVRIYIVAFATVMSCAMAVDLSSTPIDSNYPSINFNPASPYDPSMSYNPESTMYPALYNYPEDSDNYKQLQKDLKRLYHATYHVMLAARGLEDYQPKYNRCPEIYGPIYGMKLEAYKAALKELSDAYQQLKIDSYFDPITLPEFSEDPTSFNALTSDSF